MTISIYPNAEDKWTESLQFNPSLQFWSDTWKLHNQSFLSHKLKFLQIQINNHVLPTNYTVSQYNPMTSPLCTFCQGEPEKYSHLFFDCPLVTLFYEGVKNFLDHLALPIHFIKRFCIFGSNCSNGSSKENIILSLCRGYIWRQKAKKSNLNIEAWKQYIKFNLELQKTTLTITNNFKALADFEENWEAILSVI